MNQAEFLGTMVITLVPLFAIIMYFGKGAWALSKSITKLESTMESIGDNFAEQKKLVSKHADVIAEHESRISVLESHVM